MISPRFSAIAIGFFFGFAVPFAAIMLIGSAVARFDGSGVLQWLSTVMFFLTYFVSPVGAGFLAARIANVQPLLHGFIVGVLGAIFLASIATPSIAGLWSAFIFIPGGIAGGWLWKSKGGKSAP